MKKANQKTLSNVFSCLKHSTNGDYVFQHASEPDRNWKFIIISEYCCYPARKILSACILFSSTWSLLVLYSEIRSRLSSPETMYLTEAAGLGAQMREELSSALQGNLKWLVIPNKPVPLLPLKKLQREQHFAGYLSSPEQEQKDQWQSRTGISNVTVSVGFSG